MEARPHPHATFRVEKIIAISILEDNLKFYKVQWAPSWVADTNLNECENLVAEFLNKEIGCPLVGDARQTQSHVDQETRPDNREDSKETLPLEVKIEFDDGDTAASHTTSSDTEIPFQMGCNTEAVSIDLSDEEEEKPNVVEYGDGRYDNSDGHYGNRCQQSSAHLNDADTSLFENGCSYSLQTQSTEPRTTFAQGSDSVFGSTHQQGSCVSNQHRTVQDIPHSIQHISTGEPFLTNQYPGSLCYPEASIPGNSEPCSNFRTDDMLQSNSRIISNSLIQEDLQTIPTTMDTLSTEVSSSSPRIPDFIRDLTADNNGVYKCPHCPRTFTMRHKLMRHYTCHTKPYRCDKCNKSFGRKDNMKRHRIQHLPLQSSSDVRCQMCEQKFNSRMGFLEHFKSHHPGIPQSDYWMYYEDGKRADGISAGNDETVQTDSFSASGYCDGEILEGSE